jgi:hypothetical protein
MSAEYQLTPEAKQSIQVLTAIMRTHPSLRVMQTIGNALGNGDHYYLTDAELLEKLKNYLASSLSEGIND